MPADRHAPPTVVVVEDDQAVRTALTFTLQMDELQVVALASGEALLALEPPTPPACLVLDQVLNGISGLDALSVLRDQGVTLAAILITSHPNAAVRRKAHDLGATIVEKPLLGDVLRSAITQALDA